MPLTATISTCNHLSDFRPRWICADLLASKTHFLQLEGQEEQTSSVQQISADVFSLFDFKMSPHGQFLDLFIEEVLLGWRGCQLLLIHGSWVQEICWSSSDGQSHGRLTTWGHLCISHRCCLAHQLGRSDLYQSGLVQVFGGCINECQEKLLEQPYTDLSSVWP